MDSRCVLVSSAGTSVQSACRQHHALARANAAAMHLRLIEQACGCSTVPRLSAEVAGVSGLTSHRSTHLALGKALLRCKCISEEQSSRLKSCRDRLKLK